MALNWKPGFNTISKLIIQLWLFGLFLHIFGLPALERFNDKKVVVVNSFRRSGGTPAPAVTIAVAGKNANGWKDKLVFNEFMRKICKDANTTVIDCIESQTYNTSEIVKRVKLGLGHFATEVKEPWKENFSNAFAGRTYTLDISKNIKTNDIHENPLRIVLKSNLLYDLYIHDPKFFIVSRNPDPVYPVVHKNVDPKDLPYLYPFTLTEVEELNVPHDPCNEDPDYNYRECIRESFSRRIGCKTKWGKVSTKDLPLCADIQQFR